MGGSVDDPLGELSALTGGVDLQEGHLITDITASLIGFLRKDWIIGFIAEFNSTKMKSIKNTTFGTLSYENMRPINAVRRAGEKHTNCVITNAANNRVRFLSFTFLASREVTDH